MFYGEHADFVAFGAVVEDVFFDLGFAGAGEEFFGFIRAVFVGAFEL